MDYKKSLQSIIDLIDKLPKTFPEKESDDYDNGYQAGIECARNIIKFELAYLESDEAVDNFL